VTASPTSHACPQREAGPRLGAGLEGEGNEVADFVDELPRNATGKVMKHKLREQFAGA